MFCTIKTRLTNLTERAIIYPIMPHVSLGAKGSGNMAQEFSGDIFSQIDVESNANMLLAEILKGVIKLEYIIDERFADCVNVANSVLQVSGQVAYQVEQAKKAQTPPVLPEIKPFDAGKVKPVQKKEDSRFGKLPETKDMFDTSKSRFGKEPETKNLFKPDPNSAFGKGPDFTADMITGQKIEDAAPTPAETAPAAAPQSTTAPSPKKRGKKQRMV